MYYLFAPKIEKPVPLKENVAVSPSVCVNVKLLSEYKSARLSALPPLLQPAE
jgi:hypothetical protein